MKLVCFKQLVSAEFLVYYRTYKMQTHNNRQQNITNSLLNTLTKVNTVRHLLLGTLSHLALDMLAVNLLT